MFFKSYSNLKRQRAKSELVKYSGILSHDKFVLSLQGKKKKIVPALQPMFQIHLAKAINLSNLPLILTKVRGD